MTTYEEYKERLKVAEESTGSKSSGNCKPCRLKIARDTFDTLTRGSQYLSTNEPLPGYYKSVEELCYGIKPTNERMQITNPIDELYGRKMPENEPMDVIDMMYGRKMPKYKPVDVISLMYGLVPPGGIVDDFDKPNERRDLPGDIGVSFDPNTPEISAFPCQQSRDGTYYFPNDKYFPAYYLANTLATGLLSENCVITLDPEVVREEPENPIIIDISYCCKNLVNELWCCKEPKIYNPSLLMPDIDHSKYDCSKNAYSKFLECVNTLVTNGIYGEFASWGLPSKYWNKFKNKILEVNDFQNFIQQIINDANRFPTLPNDILAVIYGKGGKNKESCLCDGDKPTKCCFPDLNYDFCLCNGEPRNLCKKCEGYTFKSVTFELEMPILDVMCYHNGKTDLGSMLSSDLVYEIYNTSNPTKKLYTSEPQHVNSYTGDYTKFKMTIPTNFKAKIIVKLYWPCGFCCFQKYIEDFGEWVSKDMNHRTNTIWELEVDFTNGETPEEIRDYMQNKFFSTSYIKNETVKAGPCDIDC